MESSWESPANIIRSAAGSFQVDMWEHQHDRVEVWIEKDALIGVISGVCHELRLPYFACRGYVSQSAMKRAGVRTIDYKYHKQGAIILHLGDHDPSGIDMTRDIEERIKLLGSSKIVVKRIALNMNQVEEFNPPPNPTKLTDSRAGEYVRKHGHDSWELDALDPTYLSELIRQNAEGYINGLIWQSDARREQAHVKSLELAADKWNDVTEFLQG